MDNILFMLNKQNKYSMKNTYNTYVYNNIMAAMPLKHDKFFKMSKILKYISIIVVCTFIGSCGKRMVRGYYTEEWNPQIYTLTSDTSGYCEIAVGVNSKKSHLLATLNYYSSYQTANELIYLDYDIFIDHTKQKATKEKYTADDSNYKLIVGTENTIQLKKGEWSNLGTQLKIDTVKNMYLQFRVAIKKEYKISGELPPKINFTIYSKTSLGIKDSSLSMQYKEYEDNSAPIRIH